MPRGPKAQDLTGEIHGVWKVIERDWHPTSKSHATFWISECQQCGNRASVRKEDLMKNPRSCNNCKGLTIRQVFEEKGITKTPIHVGDRFGHLTIIGLAGSEHRRRGYWKCQCDCGTILDVRTDNLLGQKGDDHGRTISCGCATLSSGELKIQRILDEYNISYVTHYKIPELSHYMSFDVAIMSAKKKILKLIEYDGEQHFHEIEYFGGWEAFAKQQERDQRKDKYCEEQGLLLQRIPYWDYEKITIDMLLEGIPSSEIEK